MIWHRGCCRIAVLSAIALASFLPGCSPGTKKVGDQPSWRTKNRGEPSEVRVFAAAAQSSGPIVFAPSGPAAAAYNDPPIAPAPHSPLSDAIIASIFEVYGSAGVAPPRADGRLYAVATELAAIVPEDMPLPYPLVEFALQRHGIVEPSPHLVIIWGPLDDPGPIVEQLRERLPSIVASGPFARVGVGAAARRGDEGVAILALQASHIETRPIPRALPAGGNITLEGRIQGDYRKPEVFVTRENGAVEHVASGRGSEFRAKIPCAGHKGRQQVEITAVDASGSTVLANFPVWCNEVPPASITVHPAEEDRSPVRTTTEAEELMLKLVNRDRAAHGLSPLALAEDVSAVARAHSRDMHETGLVAHVSPRTGSAADRVRAARIRTSMVLENIARAYGVTEAQTGLMNSPGHRANLLSAQATHIGIGIVFGEEVAGRREMFVTQLFTRVPPVIGVPEARRQILDKIAKRGGVAHDDPLTVLAQQYADAVVSGVPAAQVSAQISKKLDGFATRFRKVTTSVMAVADIESFDARDALAEREVTHYGLGVAQGAHPELGDKALFIVLLLAQSR